MNRDSDSKRSGHDKRGPDKNSNRNPNKKNKKEFFCRRHGWSVNEKHTSDTCWTLKNEEKEEVAR